MPPSLHQTAWQKNNAFTLIELLIVIAIVATLAMLTFGASRSAQISAQNAKCIGNLRASGQAMLRYFHDRNGQLFPGKNWFQYPSTKAAPNNGMRDYFGVNSTNNDITAPEFHLDTILTCPAMKAKYPELYPQGLNRGYAINYWLQQKDPAKTYDSLPSSERPPLQGSVQRIINVPNLSAMWLLTESAVNGGLLGSINENTVDAGDKYMPYPHSGKRQNVFFFDGHIQSLDEQEFRNPKSKREFWGNLNHPPTNN